jgi:hypothetical protein
MNAFFVRDMAPHVRDKERESEAPTDAEKAAVVDV